MILSSQTNYFYNNHKLVLLWYRVQKQDGGQSVGHVHERGFFQIYTIYEK